MDPFKNEHQAEPRPILITIFAIITLVGVAFTLLSSVIPSDTFTSNFQETPELPGWLVGLGAVIAFAKLGAAILLLRMKRAGFFIYVIAESGAAILQIIGARIMIDLLSPFGNANFPISMETLIMIFTAFSLLLSLVFILVYASQLNKMT